MKTPINITLLKIQFHNLKSSLIIFAAFLILFEMLMHWFVAASEMSKLMSQFMQIAPPAMKNLLGGGELGFYSPLVMLSIAYSHPGIFFLFLLFPATFFSREIASNREKGILAINLSRPVSRFSYLCNLTIVFIAGIIFLGIMTVVGAKLSFVLYNLDQSFTPFLYVILNVVVLMFLLGSVSMFISVAVKSSSSSTGWMVGVPLTLYLLDYVSKTVKQIGFTSAINPFHYYKPQSTLVNGVCSLNDCLILIAGAVIFIVLSFVVFKHKDV